MGERTFPRLLIAGVSSGVGKTTLTMGLCRALRRRGLRVAVFKCGPDYLDPSYHRLASGRDAHNLDSWLMDPPALLESFARAAADADVALIEGVMGLFDGASATELSGSSAEIAQILSAPIALVCDASGMARSVAALAHGFDSFEPGVRVGALLCNRLGSVGHLELVRRASARIPVLGGLIDEPSAALPERHLGLHAASELDIEPILDGWAERVAAHCDVDALLALARSAPPLAAAAPELAPVQPRCRIAVAHDAAFHFYYEANLHLLQRAGAELVRFSPRDGRAEDIADVDGVYIGGGYPELHAPALSANLGMLSALRAHAAAGKPIYAECGGLMYLSTAIVTLDGFRHPMLGLVPGTATMSDKLQALGYVDVETRADTLLGPAGTRFRGHQFRYSNFDSPRAPVCYALRTKRNGQQQTEGYGDGRVLGSYVHAHWASNPAIPPAFVQACLGGPASGA
ncbi:MAG TPA: cobyrinate a,c-diamide synthase [Polyangiales bacterium]|nr:cobyrinate a,c-diamide synthase [Polyangiales bacterium]